jgi:predicted permease
VCFFVRQAIFILFTPGDRDQSRHSLLNYSALKSLWILPLSLILQIFLGMAIGKLLRRVMFIDVDLQALVCAAIAVPNCTAIPLFIVNSMVNKKKRRGL